MQETWVWSLGQEDPTWLKVPRPTWGNEQNGARLSRPLAPCPIHSDFARLCNSWNHAERSACISRGAHLVAGSSVWCARLSFTTEVQAAAAALGLHWNSIMVTLCAVCHGWSCYVMTAALARGEAVWWLPCQPGENKCVCSSLSSSSFLPPHSSHLAHPGFSKQRAQRDTLRQLALWAESARQPVCHNDRTYDLEFGNLNYWASILQLLKPTRPRTCALQQGKPLQWEAQALQWRVVSTRWN